MTTDDKPHERESRNDRNARLIREYWAARGYVVEVAFNRASFGYYIVSNLVNGLPPNWSGKLKRAAERTIAQPEPRERTCLNCRTPFTSQHFGNRLCDHCRRLDLAMIEGGGSGGPVRRK